MYKGKKDVRCDMSWKLVTVYVYCIIFLEENLYSLFMPDFLSTSRGSCRSSATYDLWHQAES